VGRRIRRGVPLSILVSRLPGYVCGILWAKSVILALQRVPLCGKVDPVIRDPLVITDPSCHPAAELEAAQSPNIGGVRANLLVMAVQSQERCRRPQASCHDT
jgi:hypothetical protein